MKIMFFILMAPLLFAEMKFEKKATKENAEAMQNEKIKCRWVCDKKLYREQKIAEAISFYKNSKDYNFSKKEF